MTVQTVILDDSWEKRYRGFCGSVEEPLIYYTWEFRTFLLDMLGCQALYLGAVNGDGVLKAVLPIMAADGSYGRVLNSLPFFGSYGGVLGGDSAAHRALWNAYADMTTGSGIAASTVVMNPLADETPEIPRDCLDERIGQITYLDFGPEPSRGLLGRIDSSARRNLQKAERSDVEVELDNGAFGALEAIHRENMAAIGGRVKPPEFFELLPRHFTPGSDYNLYVARRRGVVVGVVLLFYAGRTADYFMPATRVEERPYQPSAAILFRAMLDAAARGYTVWNWGGTWLSQEGVLRFKRKWGAVDRRYRYYTQINNSSLYEADKETLLGTYGYFYVLPFDRLKTNHGGRRNAEKRSRLRDRLVR